ncbi:hypothetical protein AC249_AIPGENE7392 [Exaiptasia diaphana]|nr:hypothetical protein AC249_AIPGENE7392 [Exaiptasia diaphana]
MSNVAKTVQEQYGLRKQGNSSDKDEKDRQKECEEVSAKIKDGRAVKTPVYHRCGPGSIPGPGLYVI